MRYFFSLLLFATVAMIGRYSTVRIGYINNSAMLTVNAPQLINYTNTCNECICSALLMNTTAAYVGLNCYRSTRICALFTNYSSTTHLSVNVDSTFIFRQLPSSSNVSTGARVIAFLTIINASPMSFLVTSLPTGVTVAGYGNGTFGSALNALKTPWGLALGIDGSLFVSDFSNSRVLRLREGNRTGSIVAGTGVAGSNSTQLGLPVEIAVDGNSNVYVNDDFNYRAMLWPRNATSGLIKAGVGLNGSALDRLSTSAGLALDSRGTLYVGDHGNHRVVKWVANATTGVVVAGITGNAGSGSALLNEPYGLYLDENNSWIYVADYRNHRIQRFGLAGGGAAGVTVAGGNGQGADDDQLDSPYAVCVSPTTGDIYVADSGNHRVVKWHPGATAGVTIAGVTGVNGTNATLLNRPTNVMLSKNETFLYVSDAMNHRVQLFRLP